MMKDTQREYSFIMGNIKSFRVCYEDEPWYVDITNPVREFFRSEIRHDKNIKERIDAIYSILNDGKEWKDYKLKDNVFYRIKRFSWFPVTFERQISDENMFAIIAQDVLNS